MNVVDFLKTFDYPKHPQQYCKVESSKLGIDNLTEDEIVKRLYHIHLLEIEYESCRKEIEPLLDKLSEIYSKYPIGTVYRYTKGDVEGYRIEKFVSPDYVGDKVDPRFCSISISNHYFRHYINQSELDDNIQKGTIEIVKQLINENTRI